MMLIHDTGGFMKTRMSGNIQHDHDGEANMNLLACITGNQVPFYVR